MTARLAALVAAGALLGAACTSGAPPDGTGQAEADVGADVGVDRAAADCEDGVLYFQAGCTPASSVDLDTIVSGGPPPDGIPPIDAPMFESVEAAGEWLNDNSPVQVVTIEGRTKAYPLAILTWHEIVNDELSGVPIVVTYCPLCNSGLVFERTAAPALGGEEETLTFGTSGRLRHSNLVMYDRMHSNLWQQFDGEAIVGAHFLGQVLERVPSQLIGFGELARATPNAQVLGRDTGVQRDYGRNPYVRYDADDGTPFLYRGPTDARLGQMQRVVGLGADPDAVAVVRDHLRAQRVVELDLRGEPVVLLWAPGQASALDSDRIDEGDDIGQVGAFRPVAADGRTLTFTPPGGEATGFVDSRTGSTWNLFGEAVDGPMTGQQLEAVAHDDTFWFVWFAFQPGTTILGEHAAS
ncbi:MAG TPA: DUF3179 domain-containing protein [Nitriliruptorales bacterium]